MEESLEHCLCPPLLLHNTTYIAYSHFLAENFSICSYTYLQSLSFLVGLSSLLFWTFAQLPQVLKNHRRKSSTSLSKCFLIEWFLGDTLNLIGCLLTGQLFTQKLTGVLFLFTDSTMILQMLYYSYFYRKSDFIKQNARRFLRLLMFASPFLFILFTHQLTNKSSKGIKFCNETPDLSDSTKKLGVIIGWVSAFIYLNSRIPQVVKNFRRKSVEGLSVAMFFCAVMGNTTYGLSVLLRLPDEEDPPEVLKHSLPWLVGSLGTLTFDFIILLQFWYFKENNRESFGETAPLLQPRDELRSDVTRASLAGIFGIRSWTSSPFLRPQNSDEINMPDLDLDGFDSNSE